LRENFTVRLGARGARRCASFDEAFADALTGNSKRCLDFARHDKGNEGETIARVDREGLRGDAGRAERVDRAAGGACRI